MTAALPLADRLALVPLFGKLERADILSLLEGSREFAAGKGDILFHRGDPCTGFHFVLSGQVKIGFVSPQGSEKVIEILGPGKTFGEAIMFMETPYVVFAQALADCQLLHFSKATIFAALARDPGFSRRMIASLSSRLHQLVADVESYSLHSGKQRIIGFLLREAPEEAGGGAVTVSLPTSKGTLASLLNLTQEHFSRILHELAAEGLIEIDKRQIHIPDLRRLAAYPG